MSMSVCFNRSLVAATVLAAMSGIVAGAEEAESKFAPLPKKISSFGAAVDGTSLYVYGGHFGQAHAHSKDNLSNAFLRLDLEQPSKWEELKPIPGLQGLPLVATGGKLYRIGGLDAKNGKKDKADLHSVKEVEAFDTKTGDWTAIAALPEGRSSHDAIAHDGKIYVVGGWLLAGKDADEVWLNKSLVLDTSAAEPKWEELPEQTFQRRALAVAAARGRIYAIGGMTPDHEMSAAVDYYDLKEKAWKPGPALPGKGFGIAAHGVGNELYCCGMDGKVCRLSDNGEAWEQIGTLETPRFFHRLIALDGDTLLAVGGASMEKGHLDDIEIIPLRSSKTAANAAR